MTNINIKGFYSYLGVNLLSVSIASSKESRRMFLNPDCNKGLLPHQNWFQWAWVYRKLCAKFIIASSRFSGQSPLSLISVISSKKSRRTSQFLDWSQELFPHPNMFPWAYWRLWAKFNISTWGFSGQSPPLSPEGPQRSLG